MSAIIPNPAPGLGYGGAEYGYSPYGAWAAPRQPYPTTGGYGGRGYGVNSYGSLDVVPPRVSSATSVDGHRVEVFFSEPMQVDAALLLAATYTFTSTIGAPVTATSVAVGVTDGDGATSVVVTHTGTTLGGSYKVEVAGTVSDVVGNPILPTARAATFLALGSVPSFVASPEDGTHVLLTFTEDVLPEADFSPGVASVSSYGVETTYPVAMSVTEAENPVDGDASKVRLTVDGMTSATYDLTVSPAEAFTYDGTVLPSAATSFAGSVVGTGSSTAGVTGLLLTKSAGVTYGWDFADTSGRVLPSSSYRVDVTFDASAAVYTPSLHDAVLATVTVSDGAVQVAASLTRVSGVPVVEVSSGGFFAQVPVAWSAGERTLSLVRNQKAGHYSLLVDGTPVVSSPSGALTGVPTIAPGVRLALSSNYAVTQFPVWGVSFSSTQTVFSASWNFLHGVAYTFVGSSALTRPHVLTKRGPLVKDWGDPTPATKADVEVRVNGVAIDVSEVNPYLGRITPAIPIPLTAAGTTSVDVDYTWFPNPAFPMPGLNTLGVVLNKWDLHQGWHPPAESPLPPSSVGVPDLQRFPMGLVLPPLHRQRPVLIGHRYIGFEKAYTAALNSPTTLLLNQNPHRVARDVLSESPSDVLVSYDGDATPVTGEFPWELVGSDAGHVGTGDDDGYYVLVDDSPGAFGTGDAGLYVRYEDLSFPASANMAARVQVQEWTLDGVYTGVGFGLHDDKFLYLVGFLEVDGVKHVGLLRDATRPYLRASWVIGPSFPITITSSTTFTTTSSAFTSSAMRGGAVFQVLDGSQAGVYTVAECGVEVDGDVATVTVDPSSPFPAPPTRWGNNTATAYLETRWDEAPTTYRLTADVEKGSAQVYVGGALSGLAISVSRVAAYPAETVLLLPTNRQGAAFWGSSSRIATNRSRWGFVRYGVAYDQATFHFKGIVVAAEMAALPDAEANHEWFVTEDFGYGQVDSSGTTLLLKSTVGSADPVLDTTYGYGRLEPFLTNQVLVDVDATFRVDSGVLGAGDAQVRLQNGERDVVFSTVLYVEGGTPYRRLVEVPYVSITGLRDPVEDGWDVVGSGLSVVVHELPLELVQDGVEQLYATHLDTSSPDVTGGRVAEARIQVVSHAGLAVNEGPIFGCTAGPLFRDVAVQLVSGGVRLVTRTSPGASTWHGVGMLVSFDWDDGAFHTYRVIVDPTGNTVVLVVDDVVLHTFPLTGFESGGEDGHAYFGAVATSAATSSAVCWESFSVVSLPPVAAKRTLGVLRGGGDRDDIDGWEIPRTDSTEAPNSSADAVVEEMDWTADVQVRVRLDPGWGVTVFRPDLPPPPYVADAFATQYTDPSAGWINVEYRRLPRPSGTQQFGRVEFGALDARSVTQQRWSQLRYRVYTRGDDDFIAPQHMVLNWCNVVTSGELLRDTGAEVVTVESVTATLVALSPTHIRADRVFNVVVGSTVLGPGSWTFDRDSQTIALAAPLPSPHTNVTVTFAAGLPVTNTYLCSQPLLQSTTLLNEGTPPVPMSQVGSAARVVVAGSVEDDPTDTSGSPDEIDDGPYQRVAFVDDPGTLYEALEFCTVDDGNDRNLLSVIDDGPGPEMGWIELALSGTSFSDAFSRPGGPKAWGGSNVAQDTVGGFNQAKLLTMSGGRPVTGGTIGPGTAILYPSYPAVAGPDRGATILSMKMTMRMSSIIVDVAEEGSTEVDIADDLAFATTATDDDPPTYAGSTDPNPTGTGSPSGHGACVAELVDASSTTYSRIGPWGGEAALAVRSRVAGGGMPASGMGFTLAGGASLGPGPTTTTVNVRAAN